ncbi:MAG: OmpP1/FadL family transporter [Pseudomonadota bacterium]
MRLHTLSWGIALALLSQGAQASGFRLPEMSVAGMGQANAMVADDEPVSAYGYNIAGMGFHPGTRASLEMVGIKPSFKVRNANGSFDSENGSEYLPALYVTHRLKSQPLAFGLGVNTPYGLKTDWPAGTFTAPGALQSFVPTLSEIRMVNVNPSVAYLLRPNLSVAVGLNYYNVFSAKLDSVGGELNGSGSGFGASLGVLYTTERFNLGLQYRSRVKVDLDGDSSSGPAITQVTFPDTLQAGILYRFTPKWSTEFDVDWTGWSSFDRLDISTSNGTLSSSNQWKSAMAYRLGTTYRVNDALRLRAGYAFDQTGQQDAHFSPRIPDADRHLIGLGAGLQAGAWTWDLGANYVYAASRTIDNSTPPSGPDLNGTSVYNGTYESSALLYGVSLSRSF